METCPICGVDDKKIKNGKHECNEMTIIAIDNEDSRECNDVGLYRSYHDRMEEGEQFQAMAGFEPQDAIPQFDINPY